MLNDNDRMSHLTFTGPSYILLWSTGNYTRVISGLVTWGAGEPGLVTRIKYNLMCFVRVHNITYI